MYKIKNDSKVSRIGGNLQKNKFRSKCAKHKRKGFMNKLFKKLSIIADIITIVGLFK